MPVRSFAMMTDGDGSTFSRREGGDASVRVMGLQAPGLRTGGLRLPAFRIFVGYSREFSREPFVSPCRMFIKFFQQKTAVGGVQVILS